jgi:hypothetical protein
MTTALKTFPNNPASSPDGINGGAQPAHNLAERRDLKD